MSTLELRNATKRYKKDTVVDNVSFSVDHGETLVLFGPSGAGKTVLLRMIAGVVFPEEGAVYIDGEDMAPVEAEDRGVGMAFQNFALFPHMSAFDNIASPLTAARQSKSRIREGVESVARLLKIDHVLDHAPRELSNGQKQRTALARSLAGSPPILLLDDPLRNVDAKLRFEMRLELPQLLAKQGATVIYVTQDYKEAMALGDRIAVLDGGRIEQMGTPADVYLTPASVDIARLFGDPVINLYDVLARRDAEGLFVELSGVRLSLPHLANNSSVSDGAECVLGVRPESILFVSADASDAIPLLIEAETPLNEKIVTLALTEGKREMLISRPAGTDAPDSGQVHVRLNPDALMLFDRASGKAIVSNSHSSTSTSAASEVSS